MTPAPADAGARTRAPLHDLPALLHDEPALAQALGRTAATLAVPEAARALVTAGLAGLTRRRPIVLAVPTSSEAERLANDLAAYLGDDRVELFPAWETLPFERVSPGVETMGRRLRVLWRLRKPDRAPDVVVASVRALVQRLGPHVEDVEPISIRRGQQIDRDDLVHDLVAAGYRREDLVEHRGELAVRGSIVDVFPSTADRPVRVDLTKSTSSPAASCSPPRRSASGQSAWSASSPGVASSGSAWPTASCSTGWSRGCPGSPETSTC
jgi:transcription-repair coupling factor (superfamily II helicase)